ncbi:hypothetical protein Pdw03_8926 [Penicillium digitatum]|uniref:Uncharacterized protein n=3 Tax=Penicillium digitatum TaxID=36651 RepID=K9FVQ9_PEND2|nr:hypothetical protein PDIP_22550 [Penicillium digitatum Pd1]EKV05166.1 hypothetical protein PDIG_84890 [Penicillium digitatum PHI26]EKV19660.1 hypothetical protein PDIP_22550 [Penicillium digitatum Pd1]QQK45025.1 hypothetical protein Pdw03_8926 [Penicillium digitatum]
MRYTLLAPVLWAVTALAVPVPNQNDVIGDLGIAANLGGDKTVGALNLKRDDEGGSDLISDILDEALASLNIDTRSIPVA